MTARSVKGLTMPTCGAFELLAGKPAFDCVAVTCVSLVRQVAFIGPGDLACSMGLVKEVGMPACWGDPRFDAATKRIAAACKASGVVAGYWNSDVKDKVDRGFRFLVVDADIGALASGLTSSLKEKQKVREALGVAPS